MIGAGMAGASAAWHLAEHVSVTVLEAESSPGYHSSGRSAALLTEVIGPPPVRDLVAAGRNFFENPPSGFSDFALVEPRGVLLIAASDDPNGQTEIANEAALADEMGIDVRRLSSAECCRMVSVLRPEAAVAGLHEPAARSIDVDGLLNGFIRGARDRGAQFHHESPVTSITALAEDAGQHDATGGQRDGNSTTDGFANTRHARSQRWQVTAGEHTLECDVVVNAAGAWCDQIAALAGVAPLGLRPLRRSVFVFPPPANTDTSAWPLTADIGGRFYFEPWSGLILASPADETPSDPCDARPEELDIALGVERIHDATTMVVRGVRATWAGLRTFATDGVPVAGFDADHPGFFWLAGQGGYGIKTSPALGELAAALITGHTPMPTIPARNDSTARQLDPAAFAPTRFG